MHDATRCAHDVPPKHLHSEFEFSVRPGTLSASQVDMATIAAEKSMVSVTMQLPDMTT